MGLAWTLQHWGFEDITYLMVSTVSLLVEFRLVHESLDPGLRVCLLKSIVYHGEHRNVVLLSLYFLVDGSGQTAENTIQNNKVGYTAASLHCIPLCFGHIDGHHRVYIRTDIGRSHFNP